MIQTAFSRTTSSVASLDGGLTFQSTLANPFPNGILPPLGPSGGPLVYAGQAVAFFNQKPEAARLQRFQVGIQRELPMRVLFDVTYVGNRGSKLETTQDLNALPIQYLSTSPERDQANITRLTQNVPNPFYPLLPGTSLAPAIVPKTALLTPFPQFTSATTTEYTGSSRYDSLQVHAERRFAQGYTVMFGYTWSKFLERVEYLNGADPLPSRVISPQDFPHLVTLSGIYELPFGKGKRWLANAPGIARAFVGGWQTQGIYNYQSGPALGFGSNVIFRGNLGDVPLDPSQRNVSRWINVDAGFERVAARALSLNNRSLSLRFNGIRGDSTSQFNLSVLKNMALSERARLQFRAEFLNAFNHPQFQVPNTDPYSTAFGTITSEVSLPRQVQMMIKVVF